MTFGRNPGQTESAIIFIVPPIDSDNTVLASEKENCTRGAICSFPSVGI
jgi:hypothetical protein